MSCKRLSPLPEENIEDFVKRVKPSRTDGRDAAWIQVRSNTGGQKSDAERSRIDHFWSAGMDILERQKKVHTDKTRTKTALGYGTRAQLLELATEHQVTVGKWMLFIQTENIDEAWSKVAQKTWCGKLGVSAKVAPRNFDAAFQAHLVCVYTKDFNDIGDVLRVWEALEAMGLPSTAYKPDCLTHLGLNTSNEYTIDPVIYRCLSKEKSTDFKMLQSRPRGIVDYDEELSNIGNAIHTPSSFARKQLEPEKLEQCAFSPFVFYQNRLHDDYIEKYSLDADRVNKDSFCIKAYINDLCRRGSLRAAVISSFRVDLSYLVGDAFLLTKSKIPTIILHGDSKVEHQIHRTSASCVGDGGLGTPPRKKRRQCNDPPSPVDDERMSDQVDIPGNFSVFKVPSPGGTYHSKFFLLFGTDCLHVVVSTGNMNPQGTLDASWVQTFPAKSFSSSSGSSDTFPWLKKTQFEEQLLDYCQHVNRELGKCRSSMPLEEFVLTNVGTPLDEIFAEYDFSKVKVSLTTSVPGPSKLHKKHKNEKYGHIQVKNLLRTAYPSCEAIAKRCGKRSLGELIVQPTSIGNHFSGIQYYSFLESFRDPSDEVRAKDCLIWPLMESLRGDGLGRDANDGCLFMSSTCFLSMGVDGALDDSFHMFSHKEHVRNIVPHTKLYMRLYDQNEKDDARIRWIKMGSDCLSVGAQGLWDNKEGTNLVRNWEMGVLFHESTTCLLHAGNFPVVTATDEDCLRCVFPIPFSITRLAPYRDENGFWPDDRIPYMHEMQSNEIYPWTKHTNTREMSFSMREEFRRVQRHADSHSNATLSESSEAMANENSLLAIKKYCEENNMNMKEFLGRIYQS